MAFLYNRYSYNVWLYVLLLVYLPLFTLQNIRAVGLVFSPMASRWVVGYFVGAGAGKVCLGCISKTLRCRKLKLVGTLVGGTGLYCHGVTLLW